MIYHYLKTKECFPKGMWCKSLVTSNGNVITDCGRGPKAQQMEDEFEHTCVLTIAISRAWFDNHISDFKVC